MTVAGPMCATAPPMSATPTPMTATPNNTCRSVMSAARPR